MIGIRVSLVLRKSVLEGKSFLGTAGMVVREAVCKMGMIKRTGTRSRLCDV